MKILRWAVLLWALVAIAENRDEWQQPERVVAELGLKPGVTVADVGCGSGYLTLRLAKPVGVNGKVLAVDVDANALDKLRESVAHRHLTNIVVIQSEPTDTRLAAGSVDVALMCDVIHEVPAAHRAGLVQDVARSLKAGGVFYLLDWRQSHDVKFDPYEKLVPRDDLIKLVADTGLVLDAEFHYLKYQVFFRFRKPSHK